MPASRLHVLMLNTIGRQPTMKTPTVTDEHILLPGVDVIRYIRLRLLLFANHRRKNPHCLKTAGITIDYVRRITSTRRKTRYHATARHTITTVHMRHQVFHRQFQTVVATMTRIVPHIIPQAPMARTTFLHTRITVRHHHYHRRYTTLRYQVLYDLYRTTAFRPRTLITIDTVQQIQHRKTLTFAASTVSRRQIDIHPPINTRFPVVPLAVNHFTLNFRRQIQLRWPRATQRHNTPFARRLPRAVIILLIRHIFPVHTETVGIRLRHKTQRPRMKTTVTTAHHRHFAQTHVAVTTTVFARILEIANHLNSLARTAVAERHRVIRINHVRTTALTRCDGLHASCLYCDEQ